MSASKKNIVRFELDPAEPPKLSKEAKSRLAAVRERDVDYSDIPELSDDWFAKAVKGAHIPEKRPVSLRLDDDVVDFFKSEGSRYQTRINAVLRAYMENRKKAHGKRGPSGPSIRAANPVLSLSKGQSLPQHA